MKAPRCSIRSTGFGSICGGRDTHEGYVHAQDANDIEVALDNWRRRSTANAVFDTDGDVVERLVSVGADSVEYSYEGGVVDIDVFYILVPEIPEPAASPEEVAAAIESIRKTI